MARKTKSKPEPKARRQKPDWAAIEQHYRANILSLRAIAAQFGIAESYIQKKAKTEGWQRDLADKVRKPEADQGNHPRRPMPASKTSTSGRQPVNGNAAGDEKKSISVKSTHGGRRPGAGRKPGVRNKVTIQLKSAAQIYTAVALKALVKIAKSGKSESARVAAASAILDRGYGKPKQEIAGDLNVSMTFEDRIRAVVARRDARANEGGAIG
jgi:hypothetical protein